MSNTAFRKVWNCCHVPARLENGHCSRENSITRIEKYRSGDGRNFGRCILGQPSTVGPLFAAIDADWTKRLSKGIGQGVAYQVEKLAYEDSAESWRPEIWVSLVPASG